MRCAVQVENLSKRYRIGSAIKPATNSLYELLEVKFPFLALKSTREGRTSQTNSATPNTNLVLSPEQFMGCPDGEFWALKDLSFSIEQGDRVGIVGKNGSGKSTLLKIMSRITPPSAGIVRINGRLISLLEVGTGFHPDLSGRENIFLNAQINGMSARGVRKIFDEIVDFSELGRQIDTPIKRYSSGMYMRLAFSVAAHLESEILIVDEVLAVGDAGFQKKCLDKMLQVSGQGRTLLFVSHDMNAISKLCNKALELSHGQLATAHLMPLDTSEDAKGAVSAVDRNNGLRTVNEAIADYVLEQSPSSEKVWEGASAPIFGDESTTLRRIAVAEISGVTKAVFTVNEEIAIVVDFEIIRPVWKLNVHVYLSTLTGHRLLVSMDNLAEEAREIRRVGYHQETCVLPPEFLNEGLYRVEIVVCTNPTTQFNIAVPDVVTFTVVDDKLPGALRGDWVREWPDYPLRPRFKWLAKYSQIAIAKDWSVV